eukprot:PITA_04286
MTDEEHTSRFLEFLRYAPYLKEEKENIQRFISGLLVSFKDMTEFDESRLLEEAIKKLKHCYEQSKRKTESKQDWKVHISSDKGKDIEDVEVLKRYLVLWQFQDVFLANILKLPPHREVDFSIDLMLGATPTSKALYRMGTLELVELKLQLKEMPGK